MIKDEALKMAIAEIEGWIDHAYGHTPEECADNKAIKACKEALEQPAQEPVAWNEEEFNAIAYAYRAFPSSEVKMVSEKYKALVDYVLSIANHAPSWQGLSDDEIKEIFEQVCGKYSRLNAIDIDFIRAIEQALKEKNNG